MRAVVTRVKEARVTETASGRVLGEIGKGFLILLGVHRAGHGGPGRPDSRPDLRPAGVRGREREDEHRARGRGGRAAGGEPVYPVGGLPVPGGPGFTDAARPDTAVPLYEQVVRRCGSGDSGVETGVFGADMQVTSQNDGPVTLILDTREC